MMGKVGSGFVLVIALIMVLSACAPTEQPPVEQALPELTEAENTPVDTMPVSASPTTELEEPTPAPSATPSEIPPTPESVAKRGSLELIGEYGYGTGLKWSRRGIQLSADEQDLIINTSAGVFIFSVEDLSPKLEIKIPGGARISRDGTIAVSVFENQNFDGILRVWDLDSGNMLDEFVVVPADDLNISGYIKEILITPDNKQCALLFNNGTIRVVNLETGEIVKDIEDYVNNTQAPTFFEADPEGEFVYYIFKDLNSDTQSVKLDRHTWQEVSIAAAYLPGVGAFSPIRSSSGFVFGYFPLNYDYPDPTIILATDYSTLAKRFEFSHGADKVSAMSFSPDGSTVVIAGENPPELEVWTVDTLKGPEQKFSVPSELWNVAASSDGKSFFGITKEGILYKFQSGLNEPVVIKDGFWPLGTDLEYTEDGQRLRLFIESTFTADNNVYEIDPLDGALLEIKPNPYVLKEMKREYPYAIAISPDKSLMAIVYPVWVDKEIRLFDLSTGKYLRQIKVKEDLEYLDFMPDGKSLITFAPPDFPIRVLDLDSGKVLREFPVTTEFEQGFDEMRLSGDKSVMVLSGWENDAITYKVYRTDTLEPIAELETSNAPYSFAVSQDGTRVAIFHEDGKLQIWDIPTDTLYPEYNLNDYRSLDNLLRLPYLAFSPDGSQLALSTPDGIIRVFNIAP
jgi:WD40 repeat protein